jgi:hypothetical protein
MINKLAFNNLVPRATNILLFILIALIPFSIRYVIESPINYQTGAYSDFTSLSIYITDIILILLLGIIIISKNIFNSIPKIWLYAAGGAIVWLFLEYFLQTQQFISLQAYFSIRFVFLIIFAVCIAKIEVPREKVAWLLVILGSIQTIIAALQFVLQKSIGLFLLGESHINPETLGVAKIVAHGTKLVRAYGTFPHPNLLAAFLVITTLFNLYLLITNYQKPRGILLYFCLFLNILGLFLTFSRGGIIALAAALAIFSIFMLVTKEYNKLLRAVLPAMAAILVSISILSPYLSTRATISDDSTKERLFYSEIGDRMAYANPVAGVGPGTSVLHMKQYTDVELKPWEIQPIHNFYIISWAEWGIGTIFLLILLLYPLNGLFKKNIDTWSVILTAIIVSILILFLFDHYFYTIWPTQLLLWLIVGLALQNSFMWNKHPSA